MKPHRPRIDARTYEHLLGPTPATPAARALASYQKATGQAPAPSTEPPAGSPAARAVALYRKLTGGRR